MIENQHQRDGDKAEARGAKCCAGEAISDPGVRPDGLVERHPHQLSQHDAGNEDRLYEEELPLLEEVGFDVVHAGARLLGRDARFTSPETAAKLEEILRDKAFMDQLLNQMVQSGGRSDDAFAQQCAALLENFTKGFVQNQKRLE